MNPVRVTSPLLLALLLLASGVMLAADKVAPPAPAGKAGVRIPMARRFAEVRQRIADLYQHRTETPAALDPRHDPFRTRAAKAPAVGGGASAPVAPASELSLLQQAVATLKVSGVFEIGGRQHLVINARPYKVGDVVQTQVRGEPVYLRVREISRRSVTLALNEAEITLKF